MGLSVDRLHHQRHGAAMGKEMTDNPPVIQVLITVQFEPALSTLNLLQAGELANQFIDRYPLFTQISRAGPMPAQFGVQSLEVNLGGMPRLQLVSSDLDYRVYLQDDRFSVGWSRTGLLDENPNYPGFPEVLSRIGDVASTVITFARENGFGEIKPTVAEILYEDGFSMVNADGENRRLKDVYQFLSPDFVLPTMGFNWVWATPLEGIEGHAELNASGVYADPTGVLQTHLQTTLRLDLAGMDWPEVSGACMIGRDNANRLFETVVNPKARAR